LTPDFWKHMAIWVRFLFLAVSSYWALGKWPLLQLYCVGVFAFITIALLCEWSPHLIGKSRHGRLPWWSFVLYGPFHCCNALLFNLTSFFRNRAKPPIPAASEIVPGVWVGGLNACELEDGILRGSRGRQWGAVVDLTCEFTQRSQRIRQPDGYLCIPTWDGAAPTLRDLDTAVEFLGPRWPRSATDPPILVHCAFGVGRSCGTLCVCLVQAGLCDTVEEAYNLIQQGRSVARLNTAMRAQCHAWQQRYDAQQGARTTSMNQVRK
jgi:protein-tyrosine phosphatase